VLLVNGDSLCRWPLARLLAAHLRARKKGAQATLLFSRRASPAAFGGGVAIDRQGFVVSFLPGEVMPDRPVARRLVFAGAHVLDAALVVRIAALPAGPADIVRDLYQPMLRAPENLETAFASVTTDRIWHDLGTPRRYLEGVLDWSRAGGRPTWISPAAEVREGARLRRAIVEAGARVGSGARLEKALVLAGAEVGAGCVVRDAIVGPGAALPAGARLEGQLAMAGSVGARSPRLTPLDGHGEG
jgi:mannose-1-phosphate guanylyltransferase